MSQDLFAGPADRPDKYRLVRMEARGGEASLWRAEVELAGAPETVAIKILHPRHHDDLERISARWAEQSELLRFVTHPSVVGVREHFAGDPPHPAAGRPVPGAAEHGRALYLVMNWVAGSPLRDWLLLHPGREGTVAGLRLLEQVADALEMLHDGRATPSGRPVVHGDLSPGNVIVDGQDRAVLVDFGLVRVASHLTQAPAGTPGFAAPEVWSRGEYTPASDRYGFAALGFFLLLGTAPPAAEADIAAALLDHPFVAGGSDACRREILAGFSDEPARRPGPGEWLRLLRGAASTSARTITYTEPVRPGPTPSGPPGIEDVEARLAGCWGGPGELVLLALLSREWVAERSWWTRGRRGPSYHVKLRDPRGHDWVLVEMSLSSEGSSRLIWADAAGGHMTECLDELAGWLVPV
jgi:serine/threonine protein kinase